MVKHLFRSSSPPPTAKQKPHHTLADSAMEEYEIEVQSLITKWTSPESTDQFLFSSSSHQEAEQFVRAVKNLHNSMHRLVSVTPESINLNRGQDVMKTAMKLLESEFCRVLKENREYLDPECVTIRSWNSSRFSVSTPSTVSDSNGTDEGYFADEHRFSGGDPNAMDDRKTIAECMISTGHVKECVRVYKSVRKSIVDETLHSLGVERLTLRQIQKLNWEVLETKIKPWLRGVKLAVRSLFYGEKILAEHVFSNSSILESSFTDITQEGALTLFVFPENVGKFKKLTSEKMFRILDMYETLTNLSSDIESIFTFDSNSVIKSQVTGSLTKLSEAVRSMMSDFETAIEKESSKKPVNGGGIHPLTRYVMNYLTFLADYSDSIAVIFENWKISVSSPLPKTLFPCGRGYEAKPEDVYSSPVSVRMAWVILLTLCKIDGKAQPFKHIALSYLFLVNNLNYVVVKVRASKLKLLLGVEWVASHEAKVKQFIVKFEKLAWGKVLTSLPEDPTAEMSSEEASGHLVSFNIKSELAYRRQISWVVPDSKLRDKIKIGLSRKIIPVYAELYNRVGLFKDKEMFSELIVRYTPDDLGNYLSDLYFVTKEARTQ
ncbi:PREDICTED: exocyst complex component EXO70A1-like [Camelina sativa]|uniref:Exocyst subunit Exo70 family protein n=1 Tax=Camelina sativa TaxID=90675 RepID=A0ABM0ZFA6_CAMSA|nr:PREDICTED: exocyst complex component EXO70A1-like [Camelina sativa]